MYFTTMNSFNEIMEWRNMKNWIRFLFLKDCLDFFQEEHADEPLRLAAFHQRTLWGDDLRITSDQLVDAANLVIEIQEGRRKCLRLRDWSDFEPTDSDSVDDPNCNFLIVPNVSDPEKKLPAAFICPGGAYSCVSFQNEGIPIEMIMENHGYRCFMLNYRVKENSAFPNAQMDLLESISYIRKNSDKYGVDVNKVVVIGFSAGGHLVASTAGLADELLPEGKPNAVVAGYPVITMREETTHAETEMNITGNDESLRKKLSVEEKVDENYPPTFAWACRDDDCVPCINTTYLEEALEKNGVLHETHIYPTGGHGCGLGYGNSASTWSFKMLDFLEKAL